MKGVDLRRRHVLCALGAAAVTCLSLAGAKPLGAKHVSLAFSTMGCPQWSLSTLLQRAVQYGFRGVELRGIGGQMDLTKLPEFAPRRQKATVREAEDAQVKLFNLCASTQLHEPDRAKLEKHMDEARRYIDLAHQIGASYVRVFPNNLVRGEEKNVTVKRIEANLGELGDYAKGSGVTVLLESHGDLADSSTLEQILTATGRPDVALLWDTGHTFGEGHEQPSETYGRLRKYVRLAQFVDFVREGKDFRYVLLGEGEMPVRDALRVLLDGGYRGYYSFDWPKLWHKTIAEPEVAFPHFVKTMRGYLASLSP